MGQQAKWLRDERYIRIAGFLLMLSPVLNYLVSIAFSSHLNYTGKEFVMGFFVSSGFVWLGRLSSFIVGYLMFRGKSSAWVPVLAILGFTIAKNIITFKHDFQISQIQTLSSIAINVGLFLLVFESEYRINKELNNKIQAARARRKADGRSDGRAADHTSPQAPSKRVTSSEDKIISSKTFSSSKPKSSAKEFMIEKGAAIDFEGYGLFAKVIHCTEKELWVQTIEHLPAEIHKKTVTLQAPGSRSSVQLKFSGVRDDSVVVFRVVS